MHRAGVDGPLGHGLGLRRRDGRIEVARRIRQELLAAPGRAEIVRLAVVLGPVLGRVRIDVHPAHRVLYPMLAASISSTAPVMMIALLVVLVPVGVVPFHDPHESTAAARRGAALGVLIGGAGILVGHHGLLSRSRERRRDCLHLPTVVRSTYS